MGQYLAIGIVNKIKVRKSDLDKSKLSVEQFQEKIQHKFYYSPELYDAEEHDSFYSFQLKQDVLGEQFIPFLEKIYPLLYDNSDYYENIIEKLKSLPISQWLEWAEEKPEEAFQLDECGDYDFLAVGFSRVQINYDAIILSMEGKTMMEVYGRQFNFFKYTMVNAFKEFTLAKALRVYITG